MSELLEHVPGFELETDLLKPFLGAVDKYVSDVIEVYDDVQADAKDVLIQLVNIILKLTIKVVGFVAGVDKSSRSDMPSLLILIPSIQQNSLKLSSIYLERSCVQELKENLRVVSELFSNVFSGVEKDTQGALLTKVNLGGNVVGKVMKCIVSNNTKLLYLSKTKRQQFPVMEVLRKGNLRV